MRNEKFRLGPIVLLLVVACWMSGCANSAWDPITVSNKSSTDQVTVTVDGRSKCAIAPGKEGTLSARPGAHVCLLKGSSQKPLHEFTMDRHDAPIIMKYHYKLDVFDDRVEENSTVTVQNSPNPAYTK